MLNWSCDWPAPAKLNLFLHITGRLPDGYHAIQTVFQLLDSGDLLDFAVRADPRIELLCDQPELGGPDNLVLKAARALQDASGAQAGASIRLHKRLPAGGGVGGGSSDAATALRALNVLWGTGLGVEALADIGRSLGADVPVFVKGHSAFAEGMGERLSPVSLPPRHYLVLHAGVPVSTSALFGARELTRDSTPITMVDFTEAGGVNVFEPLVRDRYPQIDEGMRWLDQQGALDAARLTGTGGCFFAPFSDAESPRAILSRAPEPLAGFVAAGRDRSPVIDRLELHGVR
ncbi:MAG: 4-(cytidine 5'-diphospho)-2-C-methyl-D-erythritol kinase [Pseudomonadota bacterium]